MLFHTVALFYGTGRCTLFVCVAEFVVSLTVCSLVLAVEGHHVLAHESQVPRLAIARAGYVRPENTRSTGAMLSPKWVLLGYTAAPRGFPKFV